MANLKTLSISYQNVRGLRTKSLDFFSKSMLCTNDIICLTETWLNESFYTSEFFDDNFIVFRKDRDAVASGRERGGGVIVAVRRGLCPVAAPDAPRAPLQADELYVTVPLRPTSGRASSRSSLAQAGRRAPASASPATLHIICTYIPHGPSHSSRLSSFYDRIVDYMDLYIDDVFIVLGDFNVSNGTWSFDKLLNSMILSTNDDQLATLTTDFMSLAQLKQYNYIPNMNGKYLDLVFCNTLCLTKNNLQPLVPEDSHHPAIEIDLVIEHFLPLKSNPRSFKRLFHLADFDAINEGLKNINWMEEFAKCNSLESVVDYFYSVLNELISKFVPRRSISSSGNYAPWVTKPLIKLLNEKRKYHRKWKRYGNPLDYNVFSLLRSRAQKLEAKCRYTYQAYIEEKININPKYFWTYIKSKMGKSDLPQNLTYNGFTSCDAVEICNMFNNYFNSVFIHPTSEPSSSPNFETPKTDAPLDICKIDIKLDMVNKLLKHIDVKKGAGSDGIHPLLISSCAEELTLPVTYIFRKSLSTGTFPSRWKKSLITPVPKSDRRNEVSQYRPISKLCVLGKLLEKIVTDQVSFAVRNYISVSQHGFFRGRSVETNMIAFTDFLLSAMDKNQQVDVVYTDFSKAFDKISHDMLLMKLWEAGVHGDLFRWIKSYISNRSQAVSIRGFISDFQYIPSGVPQGSHLGPLLFTLYINDIEYCSSTCSKLIYADDAKFYKVIHSVTDCLDLQNDISRISDYCSLNQLYLNIDKCFIITYTRKRNPINYDYTLNGHKLTRVEKIRDLGIIMDNKLTFRDHFDHMIQKSYKQLGFLLRVCKPFKKAITYKTLYFSLVRSVLDFGSVIWNPNYECHVNRIEKIQKYFLKTLEYRIGSNFISYEDSIKKHKLLPLKLRRQQFDQMFLFKLVNNHIDSPNLLQQIKFQIPLKSVRRTNHLFSIPKASKKYTSNAYFRRCLTAYNRSFSDIDLFSKSTNKFKRELIGYLFSKI